MTIESYTIIKYILEGKQVVIQNSNIVKTKLLNPIITFNKINCNNEVNVYIKNNSGVTIRNIIYKECINDDIILDVFINGLKVKNANIKKGIILGNLLENQSIKIKYKYDNDIDYRGILIYDFPINNTINVIYILNR